MIYYIQKEGRKTQTNRKGRKTMKKNMKGINAKVNAVIRKNINANPAELDKALKELAKELGMTWKEMKDWMADHIA